MYLVIYKRGRCQRKEKSPPVYTVGLLTVEMEPYDLIVNQPVVIDNGSGVIKAGFAGDQIEKWTQSV